jgi:hypothetical protein
MVAARGEGVGFYARTVMPEHLSPFLVRWRDITTEECDEYEAALNEASAERDMQKVLERLPLFLLQHLPASSHYWVLPQRRLGAEYVTDFLIAEADGERLVWTAVELERPSASLFTLGGNPSATLTHAMRQIGDWRNWLSRNRAYAASAPKESGLGLPDIDPELDGLIIMGRDSAAASAQEDQRRRMARESRIRIQTYDWLLAQARARARHDGIGGIIDAFFGGRSDRLPRRERRTDASDIIKRTFGSIGSVYTTGLINGDDWQCLTIDLGSGGYAIVTDSAIDYAPERDRLRKVLLKSDWDDWMSAPAFTRFEEDKSLLVTEFEPDPSLIADMHDEGEGVWRSRHLDDYEIHMLLYLPPLMSEEDRVKRAYRAKQVMIREITRLRHKPDHPAAEDDEA